MSPLTKSLAAAAALLLIAENLPAALPEAGQPFRPGERRQGPAGTAADGPNGALQRRLPPPLVSSPDGQCLRRRVLPPPLGFAATMIPNEGLRVRTVNQGSIAAEMGLEAGDVVVGMNAERIRSEMHYQQLLRKAVQQQDGRIVLLVRNVRQQPAMVLLEADLLAALQNRALPAAQPEPSADPVRLDLQQLLDADN